MNELILMKYGEIALKGLNKSSFEDILLKNIRWRMRDMGRLRLRKAQSTIYLEPENPESFDFDEAMDRLTKIFGIASISRALVVEKSLDAIQKEICGYLEDQLSSARTFKVETRRSDKQFPLKSPEISAEVGGPSCPGSITFRWTSTTRNWWSTWRSGISARTSTPAASPGPAACRFPPAARP